MAILGKCYVDHNGEIEVTSISTEVLSKVPYALCRVKIGLNLTKMPQMPTSQNPPSTKRFGVTIGNSALNLSNSGLLVAPSITELPMPIEMFRYIESIRKDDINLDFEIVGSYWLYPEENPLVLSLRHFSCTFTKEYSEREWINFLKEAGYADKWIIEIDRPKIQGFDVVLEFLDKAATKLYDKNDPAGVLSELRKSWDALEPLLKSKKEMIASNIDSGSPGEEKHPKKSERIESIKQSIRDLLNIGPHEPGYKVTYSDALLTYRLSVSLLQYYSELLQENDF